jgi:hypothetical protein
LHLLVTLELSPSLLVLLTLNLTVVLKDYGPEDLKLKMVKEDNYSLKKSKKLSKKLKKLQKKSGKELKKS